MSGIATHAIAIVPADAGTLEAASVVYVGGDGNVAVLTKAGETATFVGLSAGDILPVLVMRVNSTNTTATNLVALW
jgi:hypothetical protein